MDLRLDPDLVAWADQYAKRMRWTRTTVFEAALEALRGDAKGGVPDPPARAVASRAEQQERSVPAPAYPKHTQEPQINWFGSIAEHQRALARFRARGVWGE